VDVEIKFCGLTRSEDVAEAERLGAAYAGVILASGPRLLTTERARDVFSVLRDAPGTTRRVGVFGDQDAVSLSRAASAIGLDVVQLHVGSAVHSKVERLRPHFAGEIWGVARVEGSTLPVGIERLFEVCDAVLLDPRVAGRDGGTGVALPWEALAEPLSALRTVGSARLVLAGGLRPENVVEAIRTIEPDVVDVSSGVERSPGVKDHARMRAFADAVARMRMEP
jgi:phosphoribosylanthranilate isomerase